MQWKPIAGVALIAAAIGMRSYSEGWFRTAGPVAVEEPASFLPGHVGASFLAGYNARYRAGIDFGVPQELRFEKPNGIPFSNYPTNDCNGIPAGLNVSWALSSNGQVIKQGVADTTIWRISDGPFLAFGVFNLEGGHRYKLDTEFANDGSRLARAQPRLSVHVRQPEFVKAFGPGIKVQLIKLYWVGVGFFQVFPRQPRVKRTLKRRRTNGAITGCQIPPFRSRILALQQRGLDDEENIVVLRLPVRAGELRLGQ